MVFLARRTGSVGEIQVATDGVSNQSGVKILWNTSLDSGQGLFNWLPIERTLSVQWGTSSDCLQTSVKRHPFELDYRIAADDEGRLLGVEATLVSDCGPYTGHSQHYMA